MKSARNSNNNPAGRTGNQSHKDSRLGSKVQVVLCSLLLLLCQLLVACTHSSGVAEQAGRDVGPKISHHPLAAIPAGQRHHLQVNLAGVQQGSQVRLYLKPMYLSHYPHYLLLQPLGGDRFEAWLPPFAADCRGIDYLIHVSGELQPALRSRPHRLLIQAARTKTETTQQAFVLLLNNGPHEPATDSCLQQGVSFQPGETGDPLLAQETDQPAEKVQPGRRGQFTEWLQQPGSLSISIDGGGSGFSWKSVGGN